jgi:hypothetical protein
MADKNKIEQQVEAALGKMQKDLKQEAQKVKAEAAKAKKLAELLKKQVK